MIASGNFMPGSHITISIKKNVIDSAIMQKNQIIKLGITWSPLMHSLQFIFETHFVHVCKQGSHKRDPLSWKKPLSQTATQRVPWSIKGLAQERQACSVGPSQVSHVEWQGLQSPPSKYWSEKKKNKLYF